MVSDFGEFDTDRPPRSSVFVSYSNWPQSGLDSRVGDLLTKLLLSRSYNSHLLRGPPS